MAPTNYFLSPHIRQLIYLALYPPPTIDDEAEEEALRLEPGSPSKILSRRHKSSLTPSTKVSDAAQDLLDKFARVNTPESLACALPSYPDDPRERSDARLEDEDSYIARRALRVRDARCCWELLKEGFIERSDSEAAPSPQKPRRRRTSTRISANEPDSDEDGTAALGLVSERGWGMLAWMVTLFERDEEAVESTGEGERVCSVTPQATPIALSRTRCATLTVATASSPVLASAPQSNTSVTLEQRCPVGCGNAARHRVLRVRTRKHRSPCIWAPTHRLGESTRAPRSV